MEYIYVVPQWFFKVDIAMQILFAIVTSLVAFYSFRIYTLSGQKDSNYFGIGFLLISVAYVAKALINFLVLTEVKEGLLALTFNNIRDIGTLGIYAYILLFMAGLVTIAYVTFKIKSRRAYSLLLVTNIAIIILSEDKAIAFSLFSSLLLFYISVHYGLEYHKNRNPKTLSILIAFAFLFLSGVEYIFAADFYGNYVISNFVELIAYMLILISLITAVRKK